MEEQPRRPKIPLPIPRLGGVMNPLEGWPPGSVLAGRYEIVGPLGAGGMGAVFRAADLADKKREIALKIAIIKEQREDVVARFKRECELSDLIDHPHVIQIFESGDGENGTQYLTMELLEGVDLKEKIKTQGPLSPKLTANYSAQILSALMACHDRDVIHRDIKPENIRIVQRDGEDYLVLMDFGLARLLSDDDHQQLSNPMQFHTQADKSTGSPIYMSPESFTKPQDLDPRCDLYSLGVTMFELLTGVPPFSGRTLIQLMGKHVYTSPPTLSEQLPGGDIPQNLEMFVSKLLQKNRDQRFQSSKQALEILQKIQQVQEWTPE
jgi:eukaryotic-like serine/threonine-protein kinase